MTPKKKTVNDWWNARLVAGAQLDPATIGYYMMKNMLMETYPVSKWFKRVDTDILWADFQRFAGDSADAFSKGTFLQQMYPITGATRARTRKGSVNRQLRYVAVFPTHTVCVREMGRHT